ncbi:hypothetical protein PJL18_03618 [Paenarthrobacter nicotinovorans]|nr:hypothetical protein [Paenarthrobacter nicotinovorans]
MERTGGVRKVWSPFALEIGDERQSVGALRGGQCQFAELCQAHTQQPRCGIEDPRGIECAGQRKEVPCGVGEAGHQSAGILGRDIRNREDSAGCSDRNDNIPDGGAHAESRRRVVARSRTDEGAGRGLAGRLQRADYPWQDGQMPQGALQDLRKIPAVGCGVIPGARCIGAIGAQEFQGFRSRSRTMAGQAPGQPIMGKAHRSRPPGIFGFVPCQPTQLGGGQGCHRNCPRAAGPVRGSGSRIALSGVENQLLGIPR